MPAVTPRIEAIEWPVKFLGNQVSALNAGFMKRLHLIEPSTGSATSSNGCLLD